MVCEGEIIIEPFTMGPKGIEKQNNEKIMSYLSDLNHIKNVLINPETLLIFEL